MILVRSVLDCPIERIRSGPVIVAMQCSFILNDSGNGDIITTTGIAVTSGDSLKDIETAQDLAIQRARDRALEASQEKHEQGPLLEVVKVLATNQADLQIEKIKSSGTDTAQFELPADDRRQAKITDLCVALGITPIEVSSSENSWTTAEAIALEVCLTTMCKRFEGGDRIKKASRSMV